MTLQNHLRPRHTLETGAIAVRAKGVPARLPLLRTGRDDAFTSRSSSEDRPQEKEGHDSLDDAARDEHEYLRRRLKDELGREPSEEELDEWLRRHTEGY